MKKLLVSIVVVATLAFSGTTQAQKYGHVDAQALLFEMPEVKAAQNELERYRTEKEGELRDMISRYQQSVEQFQTDMPNLTQDIINSRRNELLEKEEIIQQFQQNFEQKYQQKEMQLIEAPRTRLLKAIEKVAAENNYTYIFDASVLLYKNGDDVGTLVKEELKSTETKTPAK